MDLMTERMRRWGVRSTGPVRRTPSSLLLDGERDGAPVVQKLALVEEEERGGVLMQWWGGRGAVAVLEREGPALLMARATGPRDLATMARAGGDEAATAVLLAAADALHAPADDARGIALVPLERWFRDLLDVGHDDPLLSESARIAGQLLERDRTRDVVLHGDLHHGNVLDTGTAWAAIDPKALAGPAAFDVANVFCNPDPGTALRHLDRRLAQAAAALDLPPATVARWVVAWCGLSLVWQGPGEDRHSGACRSVAEALLAMTG